MSTAVKEKNDFYWDNEREPHFKRRQDILKSHPEVRQLFGINPNLKYATVGLVVVQMVVAFFMKDIIALPFGWLYCILLTYFIGATIAHALFLAIHEISHDLAFKKKWYNNILAFVANLPIVFPYAMSFKVYHMIHHWKQGVEGEDTDIPTILEAKVFRGFIGKIFWFMGQILFYALRPVFVKPIKIDKWQVYNIIFQVAVMAVYLPFVGGIGIAYLLLSLVLAGSLHPTSGHFISEHYVFKEGQETYSYYGPLNMVTFNVGYHNEHHDFPNIPGSRLPQLKKMAPEFYDNLHSYKSWTGVILEFLFNKDITLYSRTKREDQKYERVLNIPKKEAATQE